MIDVDGALISAGAVVAAGRLRDEVMAVPVRDQLDLLRADLDQDRARRELAMLRYEVEAPRRVAERAAILADPRAELLAELGRVAAPILEPELVAAAAAYRTEQTAKRQARAMESIVASAARYGHSARGTSPMDRLRRWAAKGSTRAADLLAVAVARQGASLNQAIIASAGQRAKWKVTETPDGHTRAERATFHGDGRVTREIRWRYGGLGEWIGEREFRAKVQAARQRKRALARANYAVGRPQRRTR